VSLRNLNWKVLFSIGLVAGLLQVIAGVAMYVAGVYFSSWSMLISIGVLLLCIIIGIQWYKKHYLGGKSTYTQALITGLIISISTGVTYAVYNIISISFFYPNFLDEMTRITTERAIATHQTPEAIASMREMITTNRIGVANLIRLSVLGLLLSVFVSLVLKTKTQSTK
jgi:hypothetical protein